MPSVEPTRHFARLRSRHCQRLAQFRRRTRPTSRWYHPRHVHIPFVDPKFAVEEVARRGYIVHPIIKPNTPMPFRPLGTALLKPRGWFPPVSYIRDGQTQVMLTGGLLSSNERSGQVWVGDVEL
ncbi:hypothetical protein L210DRAFT_3548553 [Boletus edulis BED1]|uniref:Uncharacterized protein n=1 Tax=Boletus edulis BED1 TaxID=1328754 RepID=A0AAD4GCN0_BOLED|nr:hypothetical protein L210DRAFT_3548553 [Boletus edulis BED1]